MNLQQLIDLLTAMKTEENQYSTVFLKNIEDGQLPVIKSVLDKKYHIELTNTVIQGDQNDRRN
jgi:hypothetical protein